MVAATAARDAAAPHAERVATRAGEVMERLTAHD
jgi:hypothetical protein